MLSPREGSPSRVNRRSRRAWLATAVAAAGLVPSVGCQVEYGGMTLPSPHYMFDDVQYFPPGPEFPWANTNAATQRARMRQMGMDVDAIPVPGSAGVGTMTPPPADGTLDPTQVRPGSAFPNVNTLIAPPGGNVAPPGNQVPGGFGTPQPGEGPETGASVPPPGF